MVLSANFSGKERARNWHGNLYRQRLEVQRASTKHMDLVGALQALRVKILSLLAIVEVSGTSPIRGGARNAESCLRMARFGSRISTPRTDAL